MKKHWILICAMVFTVSCQKKPTTIVDHQNIPVPENPKTKSYAQYLKGEYLSNKNFYEESMMYFEQAQEKSDSTAIAYRMAVEHAQNFQFTQALGIINAILEKNPEHFHAKLLRAKIHATIGHVEKSQADFKDLLTHSYMNSHPQEKVATQFSLVALQVEQGQYEDAQTLLEKMKQQDPKNELVYYYLARIQTEKGDLEQAQKLFEKTVSLNNDFVLAHRALILMYEYFENDQQKIQTMENILDVVPADIQIRTQLIQNYMLNGETNNVRRHEEYFENRFEQNVSFCHELGLFYVQQKLFHSGDNVFTKCLEIYPKDDQLQYYHALALYYMKDEQKSLDMFAKVNAESDFYEKAILAQASILKDLQTHDQIVDIFKKGISQKPASGELRLHYARYQLDQGNYTQSRRILEKAIRKFDQNEPLRLMLAELYELEKEYKKMQDVLLDILEINPSSASALNFLGYSYADRGIHLEKAEQMIVKALEMQPKDGYIQDSLAWVYYKQGNFEKALKVIEVALQNVDQEPILWDHYGDILIKMGNKEKALQAYKRSLELQKDEKEKKRLQKKIRNHSVK